MYITKKLKSSFLWYTNCCPLGIHDGALIGMGSTLLDNCEVGEGSIVAAGALVLQPVRPGQTDNAKHYVAYSKFYLEEGEE